MFDATSRYHGLETAVHHVDGRDVPYVRRRFVPAAETLELLTEVTVRQGDRYDLVAARTLGASEAFWRIADANDVLDPLELTAVPDRRLRVPAPRP